MGRHHALLLLLAGLIASPGLLGKTAYQVTAPYASILDQPPPDPTPDPPDDGEAIEVSILKLKNIRYRPGRPLPQWVQDLDGKKVEIWGYMAIGTLEGLKKFELVPESCECGRSKVNHFVDVTLTEGLTRFVPGRITLVGTFEASEVYEDDFVTSLFRLKTPELPQ